MKTNKIQQTTPNFKAQLKIMGPCKFDKLTSDKLKTIAKNIGNDSDIITIQYYNEILSPYGGQCFAPSYSILPIDLTYKTNHSQKVAKFGLNLSECGTLELGIKQVLQSMKIIKISNMASLLKKLDSKLIGLK